MISKYCSEFKLLLAWYHYNIFNKPIYSSSTSYFTVFYPTQQSWYNIPMLSKMSQQNNFHQNKKCNYIIFFVLIFNPPLCFGFDEDC